MKKIMFMIVLLAVAGLLFFSLAPSIAEKSMNVVVLQSDLEVDANVEGFHRGLVIGDLHSDSLLWKRDLLVKSERGHVDLPRLQQGNVALQMFTVVTKSPKGQNFHVNEADAPDNITALVVGQSWPLRTWQDLTERALYQAEKLHAFVARSPGELRFIGSQADLEKVLQAREQNNAIVGALLGTEGSHALSGELGNIDRLYEAGFRMMSLQHFFDNKLGGSLHGSGKQGLTPFGREAVSKMINMDIMIDVAHSSEAVVSDVLALSDKPVIVSHTGFRGHCDSDRNISDKLMQAIAAEGGLIGVGYWAKAICGVGSKAIAAAIAYGVQLVGEDAVALGSDFDGTVTTAFDTSRLSLITAALLEQGLSKAQVRKVMGGNMQRFLSENLPAT